jgi:hypothetical protein
MPASPAAAMDLTDDDRDALTELTRASSVRTMLAQRASIVLLAGEGISNTKIAELVGVSRPTVILWRKRFHEQGLAGMYDEPRPGRPRHVSHEMIIAATLMPPPRDLGLTHWSSRSLAHRLDVGNATVARCWREYGVQPLGRDTYQFATIPEFTGNVADILGLFLAPLGNAIVLSVPVSGANQGSNRTDPTVAMKSDPGQEFQRFVQQFTNSHPGEDLHLVMDREAHDEHAETLEMFEANVRSHVHFTNSHASWLRLVTVWLGIVERDTLCNDRTSSAIDSIARIRALLGDWDGRVQPHA